MFAITKMKMLLFAAFALSLILTVSAQDQCDVNAVQTCITNYANTVSKIYRMTAAITGTINKFLLLQLPVDIKKTI